MASRGEWTHDRRCEVSHVSPPFRGTKFPCISFTWQKLSRSMLSNSVDSWKKIPTSLAQSLSLLVSSFHFSEMHWSSSCSMLESFLVLECSCKFLYTPSLGPLEKKKSSRIGVTGPSSAAQFSLVPLLMSLSDHPRE